MNTDVLVLLLFSRICPRKRKFSLRVLINKKRVIGRETELTRIVTSNLLQNFLYLAKDFAFVQQI